MSTSDDLAASIADLERQFPRRSGRKAVPAAERKSAMSFYVHFGDVDFLTALGNGNRSAGLAAVIDFYRSQKAAAFDAIKAAAEARDQSTVRSAFDE